LNEGGEKYLIIKTEGLNYLSLSN